MGPEGKKERGTSELLPFDIYAILNACSGL